MERPKNMHTVLVVDDEIGPREALRMILQNKYKVIATDNPQEVMDIVSSKIVAVVMLDIKMPKVDGIKLLKEIKVIAKDTEIVLITAYPSVQSAVEAMQYGAYDYVIKPFDKEKIKEVVNKGIIRCTQRKLERNMASNLMSEIYEKFSEDK